MILNMTSDEAWAIATYVRLHDQLGREHDKGQQLRVNAGLLYFKDNPTSAYALDVDTDFCWWVTRQVNCAVMTGVTPTGRNLLLKVFALLAEDAAGEAP